MSSVQQFDMMYDSLSNVIDNDTFIQEIPIVEPLKCKIYQSFQSTLDLCRASNDTKRIDGKVSMGSFDKEI